MSVWLFVLITLVSLTVLGVMDGFMLDADLVSQLGTGSGTLGLTLILLLLLFIFVKLSNFNPSYYSSDLSKSFYLKIGQKHLLKLAKTGLMIAIIVLFAFRTMIAFDAYQAKLPQSRHIITATVHIEQLSDGVYDPVLERSFRQVARIDDVKLDDATSSGRLLTVHNPFGGDDVNLHTDTDTHSDDVDALNDITVMLHANPAFAKSDLSALGKITVGDRVPMTLLITPIDTKSSANGFDVAEWLTTRHVHANAQILAVGEPVQDLPNGILAKFRLALEQYRARLRAHFYQAWQAYSTDQAQARAVTLSLLTGDRALIDNPTKQLYQLAGISHLLAISGAHVLFLAVLLSAMVVGVLDRAALRIYQRVPRWQIKMAVMVAAGLIYAVFTGFEVPAVRTVYMLVVVWLVRYLALPIGVVSAVAITALVMIWLDPFVLWQAGFWLSFVAVIILARYGFDETQSDGGSLHTQSWWRRFVQLAKLQAWLFISMLPISLLLFGKVSLWGLVVNLFAIGLFGMVIVPINLLAGVLFAILPWAADLLWAVSSQILWFLHQLLEVALVDQWGGVSAWLYAPFGMAGFALCVMAVVIWLLPNVVPRSLLVIIMTALILVSIGRITPKTELIILDGAPKTTQWLLQSYADGKLSRWLILSDQGANKLSDVQIQRLIDQLFAQGVAQGGLDGIIVQSPSALFVPAVAAINERVAVGQYWQAGQHEPLPHLYHDTCVAGLNWQSDHLAIRTLTGWRQIDDQRVWHCELEIDSKLPFELTDTRAQDGMIAVDELDRYDDAPDNTPMQYEQGVQLITATSQAPILWQLWQMMCVTDLNLDLTKSTRPRLLLNATETMPDALQDKQAQQMQLSP